MSSPLTSLSKTLAYVLRHRPDAAGVTLEPNGWTDVEPIIRHLGCTREALARIVAEDSKGRYAFDITGTKIRAVQGHSTDVKMAFKSTVPPVPLWHGTTVEAGELILKQGLKPMSRQYVHLSADQETAKDVARRRNRLVMLLRVDTLAAYKDGVAFYLAENGVWLAEYIDPKYLQASVSQ